MKKSYIPLILSSIIMLSSSNLSIANNNYSECRRIDENTYECIIDNQEEEDGSNGPPKRIIIDCSDSDPSSSC